MNLFMDTEFHENGTIIDLISIGVVREDGAKYYAETGHALSLASGDMRIGPDANLDTVTWLEKHVRPHLRLGDAVKDRDTIRRELIEFFGPVPKIWAAWGAYDAVALMQIFGRMVDKPEHWPYYVGDVIQLCDFVGFDPKTIPQGDSEHDALADAMWVKRVYDAIYDMMRAAGVA